MNSSIYYFSSTGNSQHIAKIIQNKLGGELIPMRGNIGTSCSSDMIGFIIPTYFWGIPHIVQEFLSRINITAKKPYIFSVASCGGASCGALGMVNDTLKQSGFNLSYGKTIQSVSNYIVEYDIGLNNIEKKLAKAELKAKQIAYDILIRKVNKVRPTFLTDRLVYKLYVKRLGQDDKYVVDDTCNGCGTCQDTCPANNIVLKDGKPEYLHHCEHCLACVHWCPQQAIQFGEKTRNRNRYHNPNISMQELNK